MGFGCGNDGGVIAAQRRFLVKVKAAAPKKDAAEAAAIKWMTCACSGEPLRSPIVADKLGNLMNKEAILMALHGQSLPASLGHIKSFKKDLTTLSVTWNKDYVAQSQSSSGTAAAAAQESADVTGFLRQAVRSAFMCGLSGAEANGNGDFAFLPCGHVFSTKALRETAHLSRVSTVTAVLATDGGGEAEHTEFQCPECTAATSTEQVVPLAPSSEVQELLMLVVLHHRAVAKARKASKRQRSGAAAESAPKKPRAAAPAAAAATIALPPGASSIVAAAAAKAAAASTASKALSELLHSGRKAGTAAMTTGAELSKGFIGGGM